MQLDATRDVAGASGADDETRAVLSEAAVQLGERLTSRRETLSSRVALCNPSGYRPG